MLNKEKYAKEIAEIAVNCEGIALKDNKPISCRKIKCSDCGKHVPDYGCSMKKLTEWANSEYEKSILDEAEKEYLKAVIKPFRDKVDVIQKISQSKKNESIWIFRNDDDSWQSVACLPLFEKGKKFQNMEYGKCYTLEELGL